MNKEKIQEIEQLIVNAKSELKSWANQISKYHKSLKNISTQLESIKKELNMKTLNNHPNPSQKPNLK